MTYNWRWHPITRLVAGALVLVLVAAAGISALVTIEATRRHDWWNVPTVLLAIPALLFARLLLIGAWTGEEPAVRFGDDDDRDHVA